jgi:hypothetical protein
MPFDVLVNGEGNVAGLILGSLVAKRFEGGDVLNGKK